MKEHREPSPVFACVCPKKVAGTLYSPRILISCSVSSLPHDKSKKVQIKRCIGLFCPHTPFWYSIGWNFNVFCQERLI